MTLRTYEIDDPVSSVMTKGVLFVKSSKNLFETASIMADFDVGSLLVGDNGNAVGIVTSKDIIKVISEDKKLKKIKVRDIMQTPLIEISAHETISSALLKMKEQKINHLIVVDGDKIIGMINPLNLLI
ncbi:MAG: CBS domain-containing protein [Candidatus Heimdallarchaeota archaeon]|nr:CBS domain-containing protein [Candidatus Heimdallarchaeota archaeon]MCG3255512.1 CBS domain-containing protein [Candidatus Heimdallarchaeota archaeon]MCK4610587.1 CBS domain-containing protein [Candidatus Heimdallarchaeota archaeon]